MRVDPGDLRLLPSIETERDRSRTATAAIASLAVHAVFGLIIVVAPPSIGKPISDPRPLVSEVRRVTPLVAPRFELTQKAPNTGKISREVDLASLTPRPRIQSPPMARPGAPPQPRTFHPPAPTRVPQAPAPVPEPPKIASNQLPQGTPAAQQAPSIAPPQIQTTERPKLAFETPAAVKPSTAPTGRVPIPQSGVDAAMRSMSRGASAPGRLVVGDVPESMGGISEMMNQTPAPGRQGSSLELLSDPMGVDFKPYLIAILSSVKRNWMAIIPESAKLGRQGKVVVQFAISREGRVPKLVIAMPSGTEALDRAAVAGISASNPFPPLPSDYRGDQIRVQFSFLYNVR